jgi:hypothetical protein
MIEIIRRAARSPNLRASYLDALPEAQELFVENLVSAGEC